MPRAGIPRTKVTTKAKHHISPRPVSPGGGLDASRAGTSEHKRTSSGWRSAWRRAGEFAALSGDATFVGARWIVLRAVGILFVLAFAGIIAEGPALIGAGGLTPLAGFLAETRQAHPNLIDALLRAPSLFWLSSSPTMIALLSWGGMAAALALVVNLWPRLTLSICWLSFLSFVTTWRGFSASQVDQLLLETALLCLPFAPAGVRPGLGQSSPPRPIVVFTLRWLLFRVMLESGLVKIFAGDPHWINFTALDVLYETSPFPTLLGFLDHQLPHAYHVGEIALTYAAEIVAPLLAVFAGRRGRWWAFALWTAFQAGIQLTNNFGWLNTASIGLGFLLLDDQMLRTAANRLGASGIVARLSARAATASPSTVVARRSLIPLRCALGLHFLLTLYFLALTCGLPTAGFPFALARPLKFLFWDFRSANTYTLFAGLLPARIGVEFEGSNDGGRTWRPYAFHYQPQRVDRISPFLAPRYARFEATLQVEANRPAPSPLFGLVAAQLLAGNPLVLGLFDGNPFPDRPPTLMRLPVYSLKFTDFTTYQKTGHYWQKELSGFHGPMRVRDAQGRISEATSAIAEIRAKAEAGNPQAQHLLGVAYSNGQDVTRDVAEAVQWYRKAAEQGFAEAQARLGFAYAYGEGVRRDLARAARWFQLAADQGHADSQFFVGLCYANGDGVARNSAEAARFYRLAALQGNALAQTNLGFLLVHGDGVAKKESEALAWFYLAAKTGTPEAKKALESLATRLGPSAAAAARQESETLATEIEARHRRN